MSAKQKVSYHHYDFIFDPNLVAIKFEDVRFVLVAGSGGRALAQAEYLAQRLTPKAIKTERYQLERLTSPISRFVLYKVGPVLIGDHGMGGASMSIAIHELFIMCKQADILGKITLIRFGTCGGLGLEPGSLCITNKAVDPLFQDFVELKICLRLIRRDCVIDQQTAKLLSELAREADRKEDALGEFQVHSGATMASNDFYEEQARLTGAICEIEPDDRKRFLERAVQEGVINVEMESNYLAAMCHKLGVAFGIVCVSLVDRLKADEIHFSKERMDQFLQRLFWLNLLFIRHKLDKDDN